MNRRAFTPATIAFLVFLAAFFGLFLVYPVSYMLRGAFWVEGRFTLEFFGLAAGSPLVRESLANSFLLGVLVTLLTTLLTLPLAHLFTRYDFPGKTILSALLLVPMIMPPFVGAIGIRQFLGQFGSVNLLLGTDIDWLGGGGFWGVVILQTLNLYPIMFLNVSAAMANVDPTLRDAADNLGASPWRVFRTVTLPLILPGYFAGAILVFIWALTDLGTPLIFGLTRVVSVQIFDRVTEAGTNPMGFVLVCWVLVLTVFLFVVSKRLLGSKRYEMLARGHTAGSEKPLQGWPATMAIVGVLAVIGVALLPHISVALQSLSDRWFFTVLPTEVSVRHYGEVFEHGLTASSIRNSLFYSSLSAGVDLVLGVMIAYLLTRRQIPGGAVLDALAMLPLALPGLVLAFGYVGGFNWPVSWLNPRTNPTLLLVVAYSVRRLPYIVRSAYAGFQQTSVTLEEASLNLGASPARTLRKITIPLVMANLVAGTILTFSYAMLEVSDSLILAMREKYYPITKAIYSLLGRIDPNSASVASALGILGMVLLTISLLVASKVLGKKMGQLFRAG
jgi:iron(III) transport system permease protein